MSAGPLMRYIELHGCEDLAEGLQACVETVSTSVKRRRFTRAPEVTRIKIAVTNRYLVWVADNGDDQVISAARLRGLEAREYRSELIQDSGLDVLGFRLGGSERESWFLPLDQGDDGQDLRDRLQSAIRSAGS